MSATISLRPVGPVLVFSNLCVACFDAEGNQIPELQKALWMLLAEHAEEWGYDLDGATIETPSGNWKIIRSAEGWRRETI